MDLQTLIIDNYDSYTFNLFQYFAQVNGRIPHVIHHDQIQWNQLKTLLKDHYDNVVISPGPGLPQNKNDFGVSSDLFQDNTVEIPILGVCLGHQGLAHYFGGKIIHAPQVAHGVVSSILHTECELFHGIPSPFKVVRYHSWIVDRPLPPDFEEIGTSIEENLVMAIQHKKKPFWGVQFHPESICTEHGIKIIQNFSKLTKKWNIQKKLHPINPIHSIIPPIKPIMPDNQNMKIKWEKISYYDSEAVFMKIYGNKKNFFWLDSSRVEKNLSRFSFIGSPEGPSSFSILYNVQKKIVTHISNSGKKTLESLSSKTTFFDYLQKYLNEKKCRTDKLPFEFISGFVGYFGYEMKVECGSFSDHQSRNPDAAFFFIDRMIVFDHEEKNTYLVGLIDMSQPNQEEELRKWMENTKIELNDCFHFIPNSKESSNIQTEFNLDRDYLTYKSDINNCLDQIYNGESYELCLTNKIEIKNKSELNPLTLYHHFRRINPAPYSALFRLDDFFILSCSPERFMKIDQSGVIESKPIKGTQKRGETKEEDEKLRQKLQDSKKDFSENLMIVDLSRNDIGKVCEIGSVHVPKLMNVESYATAHQLVSTVRGQLRKDLNAIDCIVHSFPPGSMTGAPKHRSMEILEKIEKKARGIYSGALGYLGLNGSCDLSVIIRTLVLDKQGGYIGCGGAIVAASNPEEEFQEMLLKANALIKAILFTSSNLENVLIPVGGVPKGLKPATNRGKRKYEDTIENFDGASYLASLSSKGMSLGLDRIQSFLSKFDNPQEKYPVIHVTGTNGKGSVCAFLTSILKEAGYAVGCFTSPHLIQWRESITINGQQISEEDFNSLLLFISNSTKEYSIPLTQFEVLTCAAYYFFQSKEVDLAVIEVGLGGKHDATNVISSPLVSIIVSIGLDHENVIGPGIKNIAKEKAGIIKKNCPVIIGQLPLEAFEIVENVSNSLNSPLICVQPAKHLNQQITSFEDIEYKLNLIGEHQLINSAIAVKVIKIIQERHKEVFIKKEDIQRGIEKAEWPARLQYITWRGFKFLIDGAHNLDAAKELKKFIDSQRSPSQPNFQWIIGMLGTKDHLSVLEQLFVEGDSVCIVPVRPNVHWLSSADPQKLTSIVSQRYGKKIQIQNLSSVEKALEEILPRTNLPVVVSGSLHLCGQVLKLTQTQHFQIFETLLFTPETGYYLLQQHLIRLEKSVSYFGFKYDRGKIEAELLRLASNFQSPTRIKLTLFYNGHFTIRHQPFVTHSHTFSLILSHKPINRENIFLYHKTTYREPYNEALFQAKTLLADDAILLNEKEEITETSIANIAVRKRGQTKWVTPPVSCGLLPGVMRQELLSNGEISEEIITIEDLKHAEEILLFNSVRGKFLGKLIY